MNKLIRGLGIAAIGGATMLTTSLTADSWCWDACRWDGSWEVGAEALYWKPCGLDWNYGYSTVSVTEGSVTNTTERTRILKPDYQWGFRILGGYFSCSGCTFLTLDWIYLRPIDTTTTGDLLRGVANVNGDEINTQGAKFRVKSNYNRVNLRGGYYLYRGCDISFYMFGGIRWLELHNRNQVFSANAVDINGSVVTSAGAATFAENNKFWGIGIEVGVGTEYHLGCGFNLAGYAAGTTALGEKRFKASRKVVPTDGATELASHYTRSRTQCVPGVDFRLGVNYTYDCFCVSLKGEIGYELNYYFGIVGSTEDCTNVGFGGPYASLKLCF